VIFFIYRYQWGEGELPVGRPPIEIDELQLEKLANLGCSNEEIANFFECSTDTIERRFAGVLSKARASCKIRLRRLQLLAAEKGNVVMLIWLGKQMLGQKDKLEHSGDDDKPLSVTLNYKLDE
jgi:predicted metal-dependent hydrolase